MPVSIDRQRGRAVLVDMTEGARVQEVERLKMKTVKNVNVKKLALAGILVAVGIVCSPLSIPVGASKCAPVQHSFWDRDMQSVWHL